MDSVVGKGLSFGEYINQHTLTNSVFPGGLEYFLQNTIEGKLLLSKRKLTEYHRNELCALIIKYCISRTESLRISSEEFVSISEEIPIVFPAENKHIYFTPYRQFKSRNKIVRVLAKGKLWAKYNNEKRRLKKFVKNQDISEADKEVLKYLKTHISPFDQIRCTFKLLYQTRQILLDTLTTSEYIASFPVLKHPEGYKLLCDDFGISFPGKENCFRTNWPDISNRIINIAMDRQIQFEEIEDRELLGLKILPDLFSTHMFFINGKRYRPSISEIRDSFYLDVHETSQLTTKVEERRNSLKKLELEMQPFVVNANGTSYVSLDSELYHISEGLPTAFDVCFKLFLSLKLMYPVESKPVWMFLQSVVYDISTDSDVLYPTVCNLKTEILNAAD